MHSISKIGFILATLGSSIGLGHIWRFPYMAGEMGGSAFVLLFLILALCIGTSLLIADMIIGNKGQSDVVHCFANLDSSPKRHWGFVGIILLGGPLILSFYAVVLGQILYYLFWVSFSLPNDMASSQAILYALKTDKISYQILGFSVVLGLTGLIVSLGVKEGIERLNVVLMPLLFIIFIGLLVYAAFQPAFWQAVHFLFDFKYQVITPNVLIEALAQMFFSLSLGVGTIITYAAASQTNQNLLKSALWVVLPGLMISLIAGLVIFTFFFGYNGNLSEHSDRTNLVFIALPLIFSEFGNVGQVLCVAFLSTLLFAGITSTISLLEPSVYYLMKHRGFTRKAATFWVSLAVFALGLLALFSQSPLFEKALTFSEKNIFTWFNIISTSVIMPFGAFVSIVFVGFIIKKEMLICYTKDFLSGWTFALWLFVVRYVDPLVIVGILFYALAQSFKH